MDKNLDKIIEDNKKDFAKDTLNKDEYHFEKEGHCHYLGDKPLTGITTILQVLAKPALIQWAANMAVGFVKEVFETSDRVERPLKVTSESGGIMKWFKVAEPILNNILEEARTAHRKKKEEAGQKGTDVHSQIEDYIKEAIKNDNGFLVGHLVNENPQISHFVDWAIENKVKFLDSEKHIYSKVYFLGGICDFVCEIDGEIWLGDIKTGSGIYPEHFWQIAGYQLMFEEMGIYKNIKGHIVVNLKKDGTFDEKRSVSNEDNRKAFLACLTIYRIQEKIKNQIIN